MWQQQRYFRNHSFFILSSGTYQLANLVYQLGLGFGSWSDQTGFFFFYGSELIYI